MNSAMANERWKMIYGKSSFLSLTLVYSNSGQTGMSVLQQGSVMAIGWGKSYEEQMEEASQRASEQKRGHKPEVERKREQALESLRLSRARIEQQLSRAVRPAHREMLMKALQSIEKQADELSQPSSSS
jgi:hypothetical protein